MWLWFDMPTKTATGYRFRFRYHIKPRIIIDKSSWNVVEDEMFLKDMVVVRREYLKDLLASQRDMMTHADYQAYVKPTGQTH